MGDKESRVEELLQELHAIELYTGRLRHHAMAPLWLLAGLFSGVIFNIGANALHACLDELYGTTYRILALVATLVVVMILFFTVKKIYLDPITRQQAVFDA
jgi:hypothetical protein